MEKVVIPLSYCIVCYHDSRYEINQRRDKRCKFLNVAALNFTIPFDMQHNNVKKKVEFQPFDTQGLEGGSAREIFATMWLHT